MAVPLVPVKMSLGSLDQEEPDKPKKRRKAPTVVEHTLPQSTGDKDMIDDSEDLDDDLRLIHEALEGPVPPCFKGLMPTFVTVDRERPGHQLKGVDGSVGSAERVGL